MKFRLHKAAPKRSLAVAALAALVACDGGDGPAGGAPPEPPPAFDPVFSAIQDNVFTPTCATTGCHTGAGAPQGLSLDADSSYGLLVGVPSSEVPAVARVEPGAPDESYLIRKLEGTASAGGRMPLGRPPLPEVTIDVIRQWILDGALDDRVGSAAPLRVVAVRPAPGSRLDTGPERIVAVFNRPLDVSTVHRETVFLLASGGDATFGDGNERQISATGLRVTGDGHTVVLELDAGELAGDEYRFLLRGSGAWMLLDLDANALDGEFDGTFASGDGVQGGDFAAGFSIARPTDPGGGGTP